MEREPSTTFPIEIESIIELSSRVRLLRLVALDGALSDWSPMQYVSVQSPREPGVAHFYSIASSPQSDCPGVFELCAARGKSAAFLEELVAGDRLEASGPLGQLSFELSTQPLLLIGMGTGVSPLRALLQRCAGVRATRGYPVPFLLVGQRQREDLLFHDEFVCSRDRGELEYFPVLSSPDATWQGPVGRLQTLLPPLLERLLPRDDLRAIVCGSREMTDEVAGILRAMGLPEGALHVEGY